MACALAENHMRRAILARVHYRSTRWRHPTGAIMREKRSRRLSIDLTRQVCSDSGLFLVFGDYMTLAVNFLADLLIKKDD
eukprot:SAG11_NODE_3269_length_2567_cov_2.102917_1_plen_80_part_00